MARVEIILNNNRYAVACEDGSEDRLKDIAAFVDLKLRGITSAKGGVAEIQALVLTLLTLGDQIFDLRSELAKARTGTGGDEASDQRAAKQIDALAGRIDAVATRLVKV